MARMKGQRNRIPQVQSEHSNEDRKREAVTVEPNIQASPLKRRRSAGALDKPLIPATSETVTHPRTIEAEKSTKSARRYGKKRKASSPPPNLATGVNFDELPMSEAPLLPKRVGDAAKDATIIDESRKTRTSVTQRKNKKVETPMIPIENPKKRPLKPRPQRAPKTRKPKETHAASVVEGSKKVLPQKAVKTKRVS